MSIGPYKETLADVFKQRVAVGGFMIVKDLILEPKAGNEGNPIFLFKDVNHAVKGMASGYLHTFLSRGKA
jgi:hypothetical protein